jgi:hypothetical protein
VAQLSKGVYYVPERDAYKVVLEGISKTFNPRKLGVTKAEALKQANEFAKNYIKNNPDLYTADGTAVLKERKATKTGSPKRFDKRFQNWYETQYLPKDSVYNKFKTGGAEAKGANITKPFKDLDSQEIANLYRNYETNKKYIPVYERIKRLDLVTGDELGEIVGVDNMKTKAKELMYPPKRYKRQKNIFGDFFKKNLKAKYIDIGQGGFTAGTLFYKRPNEEQILKMQEYFNRQGAKFGITTPVQERVKLLHNHPKLRGYVRKGQIVPENILTEFMTLQEGAHATLRLAQIYNGHKFPNVDLKIDENKNAGRAFFKAFEKFPFQNPYRVAVYKAAMETITKDLGKDYFNKYNLENLKREAGKILNREGIPLYHSKSKNPYGVNINEITGITASARTGTSPYSQFMNIMEGRLNQVDYARFLKTFEKKQNELAAELAKTGGDPNKIIREYNEYTKTFLKQIKDPATRDLMKGLNFPRLKLSSPEKVYGATRIKQLQDIGLDLPKAYEDMKYTIEVPKGTATLKEFVNNPSRFLPDIKKQLKDIVKKAPVSCQVIMAKKTGGLVPDDCIDAIDRDPIGSAEQLSEVKPTNKSLAEVKGVAQRILNIFPKLGTVGKIGTVAAGAGIALSGLRYNPEKGEIVTTDNDQKADQNQILQYVKDNPLKVTAGSSLGFAAQEVPGAYKAARDLGRGRVRSTLGISGALRPVLTTFGTPLLTGLYEGAIGAKRLEEGETMTDVLTDPLGPALGVSLMEPLSKLSGVVRDAPKRTMLEGARNYFNLSNVGQARPGITGKILRMGLSPKIIAGASRFLGLPGLALGLGMTGYDAYKNYQNQEGMIYNLFNRDE